MRKRSSTSALALAILAIGFVTLKGQSAVPALAGVVTDTSGIPIANAQVSIMRMRYTTHTRADGQYVFDTLPNGLYTVRAQQIGFLAGRRDSILIAHGTTKTVDFRLRRPSCDLDCNPVVVPAPPRKPLLVPAPPRKPPR